MSQGVVTEHLVDLIAKQVEDHAPRRLVRPGAGTTGLSQPTSTSPNTTVARYDGCFLQLRHEIDPLLNDLQPPRLVVYVPMDQGRDRPRPRSNSKRRASSCSPASSPPTATPGSPWSPATPCGPSVGDENAAEVEKQVEAGKLTLADLDAIGEQGKDSRACSPSSSAPATPRKSPSASWPATASTPRSRRRRPVSELADLLAIDLRDRAPRQRPRCPRCGTGWPATSC